ncbi:hypothetical protein EON81_26330, partial [bacterium]
MADKANQTPTQRKTNPLDKFLQMQEDFRKGYLPNGLTNQYPTAVGPTQPKLTPAARIEGTLRAAARNPRAYGSERSITRALDNVRPELGLKPRKKLFRYDARGEDGQTYNFSSASKLSDKEIGEIIDQLDGEERQALKQRSLPFDPSDLMDANANGWSAIPVQTPELAAVLRRRYGTEGERSPVGTIDLRTALAAYEDAFGKPISGFMPSD